MALIGPFATEAEAIAACEEETSGGCDCLTHSMCSYPSTLGGEWAVTSGTTPPCSDYSDWTLTPAGCGRWVSGTGQLPRDMDMFGTGCTLESMTVQFHDDGTVTTTVVLEGVTYSATVSTPSGFPTSPSFFFSGITLNCGSCTWSINVIQGE